MRRSLGENELELLRYVAEHQPITVRDMADSFGEAHGWARTTVLTVMERLRKKGFLRRQEAEGGFLYSCTEEEGNVLREVVSDFVRSKLKGSLSPFAAYLAKADELSEDEVRQLREALDELERRQRDA